MSKSCDGCRWWSELIASSIGLGPVKAMCLYAGGPMSGQMVNSGCDLYLQGQSVDLEPAAEAKGGE